jgi:hypothetical protein
LDTLRTVRIRLVSWNVGQRELWSELTDLNADVALLQEAKPARGKDPLELIPSDADPWSTAGFSPRPWRTAIARICDRVTLTPRPTMAVHTATSATEWTVSRVGNITAADVNIDDRRAFTAVSVYASWEGTGSRDYADAEAHRILSDLTALMGGRRHGFHRERAREGGRAGGR